MYSGPYTHTMGSNGCQELGDARGGATTQEGIEFGTGNAVVLYYDHGDSFMMAFTGRNSQNHTWKSMNLIACKLYLHQKIKITSPKYHCSLVLRCSPGTVSQRLPSGDYLLLSEME